MKKYVISFFAVAFTLAAMSVCISANTSGYRIDLDFKEERGGLTASHERAERGELIEFTADDYSGYELEAVYVYDGRGNQISVEPSDSKETFYFTMPNDDVQIYAKFVKDSEDKRSRDVLPYNDSTENLRIPVSEAKTGDIVYVYPDHDVGKIVDVWVTNSRGVKKFDCTKFDDDGYFFIMPASEAYVRVVYDYIYETPTPVPHSITVKYSESCGTVKLSDTHATEKTKVYINPNPGWQYEVTSVEAFAYKKVNGSELLSKLPVIKNGDSYYFNMPDRDVRVEVNFARRSANEKEYKITYDYDAKGGFFTDSISGDRLIKNTKVTIRPTARSGYRFVGIKVTEVGSRDSVPVNASIDGDEESYSFYMPANDVTVKLNFVTEDSNYHKISCEYNDEVGKIYTSSYNTVPGTKVSVFTKLNSTHVLSDISVITDDGDEIEIEGDISEYYFIMPDSNVTVKAEFKRPSEIAIGEEYRVDITYSPDHGTASLSRRVACEREKVEIFYEADDEYRVSEISVIRDDTRGRVTTYSDGAGKVAFTMPDSDVSVNVTFEPINPETRHSVKMVFDGTMGEAELSHEMANPGENVAVGVTPADGFSVSAVAVSCEIDGTAESVAVREIVKNSYYTFTMPDADARITVLFKESETPKPVTPESPINSTYTDVVTDAWYSAAVKYVTENGIMNGYSADIFAPEDTTTRAMIATIIWRLEGSPVSGAKLAFSDVKEGTWYTDAVRWAAECGIVNGKGDGTFAPEDKITREQLCAMLHRYDKHKGGGKAVLVKPLNYGDIFTMSDWATEAIIWCTNNEIIRNVDGLLRPTDAATRAEAADMLMRYGSVR